MSDVQQNATIQYSYYYCYFVGLGPLVSSHSELIYNYESYRQLVGLL
jgi:hypothetical protein